MKVPHHPLDVAGDGRFLAAARIGLLAQGLAGPPQVAAKRVMDDPHYPCVRGLLLETDHPFGDRPEAPPRRPGSLANSESAVSAALRMPPDVLRHQTWSNLKDMAERLSLVEMFPRDFQVQFLAV